MLKEETGISACIGCDVFEKQRDVRVIPRPVLWTTIKWPLSKEREAVEGQGTGTDCGIGQAKGGTTGFYTIFIKNIQ